MPFNWREYILRSAAARANPAVAEKLMEAAVPSRSAQDSSISPAPAAEPPAPDAADAE